MRSVPLTNKQLKKYDVVLISTAHDDVDYQMVSDNSTLIVDTRNATEHVKGSRKHIIKA